MIAAAEHFTLVEVTENQHFTDQEEEVVVVVVVVARVFYTAVPCHTEADCH